MKRFRFACLVLVAMLTGSWTLACPFCSSTSLTLTEEIDKSDAVVIAKLVEPPAAKKPGEKEAEVPKAKFEVTHAIKGESMLGGKKTLETLYFGSAKKGTTFMITGIDPRSPMWSSPMAIEEEARAYLLELPKLPKDGVERLKFFQRYLEHRDELLARDAYDEFAKAPYEIVKALQPAMDHAQLVDWVRNPDVSASRRRLYLTMLGVCGSADDLEMLESMLRSGDRKTKAGLDAMIACYLTIKGKDGMDLVEELFLNNPKADYADTYAAIMAVRFHGDQSEIIPKERLLKGLRYMLDRPQLADLVVPDLTRWKDWSQMERLAKLFKEADEKSSWVRVPVINYLRACPNPEAKELITELEKIDPAAVKRANTFFPLPAANPTPKTSAAPPDGARVGKIALAGTRVAEDADASLEPDARFNGSGTAQAVRSGAPPTAGRASQPPAEPSAARLNTRAAVGVSSLVVGGMLILAGWLRPCC